MIRVNDMSFEFPMRPPEEPPASGSSNVPRQRAEGFRRVLAILRRRWLVFVAIVAFALGGTAWFSWHQTPLYTATASLVVNSRALNVASKELDVIPTVSTQDGAVDTEIQILGSREVITRAVRALDLTTKGEFVEALAAVPEPSKVDAAYAVVRDHLDLERPGTTNVVTVSYTSPTPDLAKAIADEIGRQYLLTKANLRTGAADAVDEGLSKELETLRGQVQQAEAAVARYKTANNLLSSDGVMLTEQEISLYKQQLAKAQSDLAEEQARLNTARAQLLRGSKGDDVGEALNSTVVEQLRTQRSQISTKLAELKARYRGDHPDVIKVERQLADIDADIQSEIGRVISNLEARTQVAAQRAAAAETIAGRAAGTLATNNAASVRLAELERQAEAYRSNYAAMLQRQNAISTQATIADEDARIFSAANLPRVPVSPNKALNMAVGGLLGIVLGGLVVWLLHLFDRGIVTSRDAETRLGLRHLANIPTIASIARAGERKIAPELFTLERPLSMYAEALRGLWLALVHPKSGRAVKMIGITSSCPDEGKSTLALSLARTVALAGQKTLLIDGDVRRPSIARMMEITPTVGFADVLSGAVRLEDAVVKDPLSDLMVLPSPVKTFSPQEIFRSEAMEALGARLRGEYDLVIVDTAPALAVSDARALLEQLDTVALVVRWKQTLLPVIHAAMRKLRHHNLVPAGVVLTQVNMKAVAAYGYGDVDYNYRTYAEAYQ